MTEETPHTEPAPPPPKKRSWFSSILLWLNWLAIAALALACLAPFVSPAVFWPLAFFGLLHPAFAFVNFLFLLWWLFRRKKTFIYPLALLLLSLPFYGRQFHFTFGKSEPSPANAFTVMSYNVKLFDLYNWSHNKQTRSKMFSLISSQHPAILNLQEFFTRKPDYPNLDSLKSLLHLPHAHAEYTIFNQKGSWGVVTFSRFPIVDQGRIVFNNRNNNICIYTDLLVDGDTIRVYNMHLQSVSFGYADYKFMEGRMSSEDMNDEMESSKNILRRMKRAYTKRARQAESIASHIAACPYPVIVCGDFNDPPVSYTYRTISANLEDAFYSGESGFGKTFVNPFPVPRIDYILHSASMHSWQFRTLQENGLSDHYPVVCEIGK